MPEFIGKITNDDGTQVSVGPIEITKTQAGEFRKLMDPLSEKENGEREKVRAVDREQLRLAREQEAEAHAELRMQRAEQGLDPDGDDG